MALVALDPFDQVDALVDHHDPLAALVAVLSALESTPESLVHVRRLPRRPEATAPLERPLPPEVAERLGVEALWTHQAQAIDLEMISTTKMFDRVRRSLTALFKLLEPPDYLPLVSGIRSWDELRKHLTDCLNRAWHPYWLKRKPGKPNPRRQRPKKPGAHFSVQRVLNEHAAKKEQARATVGDV